MKQCHGHMAAPGTFTEKQMFSLGQAVAKLHIVWKDHVTDHIFSPSSQQPLWEFQRDESMKVWDIRWSKVKTSASKEMQSALLLQKEIIEHVNFDFEPATPPGWAHLDLWADNLLFDEHSLCGIVDFDRTRYSYPILDIGRALLSGCLNDEGIQQTAAATFAEGYCRSSSLQKGDFLKAVQYTWLIESFWWFDPSNEPMGRVPARFFQEMFWIAQNWGELDLYLQIT